MHIIPLAQETELWLPDRNSAHGRRVREQRLKIWCKQDRRICVMSIEQVDTWSLEEQKINTAEAFIQMKMH